MRTFVLSSLVLLITGLSSCSVWGKEKVKLTDISTLTLYQGKMTTGRRSSPVPQLHCIGGTAGCAAFVPQVVQCHNSGSDGFDAQWECKTDMDNTFRFGRVEVLCEGYDYPDDPYVLKGSCGMEYTLDLTMEGMKKQQGHNYYGGGYSHQTDYNKPVKGGSLGNVILLVIVLLLIYGLYKTCVRQSQYSPTDDGSHGPDSGFQSGFGPSAPPPPGFRPGYTPGYDAGCSGTYSRAHAPSGAGNFWSGAMTGGLLGYMFGSRNSNTTDQGFRHRSAPAGGDSWGGTSSFSGGLSGSSGTRTASGFGGTRRR